jgi:hypothetical protein
MPTGDSLYLMVMIFYAIVYNLIIKQDIKYCDPRYRESPVGMVMTFKLML